MSRVPIFDLDGTLLDSDEALVQPFLGFGVRREDIVFGEPLGDACERLGVDIDAYLDAYDVSLAQPFPGVDEMVRRLERWAVASNKYGVGAHRELERLKWQPDVVMFSEDFEYRPKELKTVLLELGIDAHEAVFIGDTDGDRQAAAQAGVTFALSAWNPRALSVGDEVVLRRPMDVFELL